MDLLISVMTVEEAVAAAEGGATIVDVKNPIEGALGANFPSVIRRIREVVPAKVPVSAALGDVPNLPGTVSLAALGAAVSGVQYVKVGLLGPDEEAQALYMLQQVCRAVREHSRETKVIATGYADALEVGALPPLVLPEVTAMAGADGCLLDTFAKGKGGLFSSLDDDQLGGFVRRCRELRLLSALAGSLTEVDIPRIRSIGPDIIGFRSAACRGDRVTGRVDAALVRRLKATVAGSEFQ